MLRKLLLCCLLVCAAEALGIQAPKTSSAQPNEWPVGTAESVQLSSASLQQMEGAIRSGEFKKISAVLVARHGKLVYENYFGGAAANTLLDTSRLSVSCLTTSSLRSESERSPIPSPGTKMLDSFVKSF